MVYSWVNQFGIHIYWSWECHSKTKLQSLFLGAHQKLMSSQVVGGAADTMSCLFLLMLVCFHVWLGTHRDPACVSRKLGLKMFATTLGTASFQWLLFLTCNNLWKMWYCFIIICKRLAPNVGLESMPAELPLCNWAGPPHAWRLGNFILTRPLNSLPPTKRFASLVSARPVLIRPRSGSSDRGLSLSQLGSANIFRSRKKKVTIIQNSSLHLTHTCLVL